ncbi:hypothetical protein REPUB_Repub02eG0077600 [Reevesia pubescens]
MAPSLQTQGSISYLTQREAAAEVDETLMGPLGFSVDQLMELAGLSVATSIAEVYKPSEHNRVLAICGPGNNGGDGLVAARHLYQFVYKPFVCYPKRTAKPLYSCRVTQLESLSVPFLPVDELPVDLSKDFDILVDAMFGFSFHGAPRPPFDNLIQKLVHLHNGQMQQKSPVIVSVDIPSGWHVEEGTSMCVRIGKPPQIDISVLRENYISLEFLEEEFRKWFDDAVAAGLKEPNAMALSTTGKDRKPSSRMVLLKRVDKDGFFWYTNYESRKAHHLSENPHASLIFYWDMLNRQVRVEGSVQKVSDEESEQYFHSRPRGSQIGEYYSSWTACITPAIQGTRRKILCWVGIFPSRDQWKTSLENCSFGPLSRIFSFFTVKFTTVESYSWAILSTQPLLLLALEQLREKGQGPEWLNALNSTISLCDSYDGEEKNGKERVRQDENPSALFHFKLVRYVSLEILVKVEG